MSITKSSTRAALAIGQVIKRHQHIHKTGHDHNCKTKHTTVDVKSLHTCCHHFFPEQPSTTNEELAEYKFKKDSHHDYQPNVVENDYAYEIKANHFKFGPGVLKETGVDAARILKEFGVNSKPRIAIYTDKVMRNLETFDIVYKSIKQYVRDAQILIYDDVAVEPTDVSYKTATQFVNEHGQVDLFISVGGGSVMDTVKAVNLYSMYPPEDFLDYVNPPIGKGLPVPGPLKPHIAIPTTCGTGSEATGFAIFDLLSMKAKTGIAHHELRPTMAIIDPTTTLTMPANVVAASGFDVLSHGLESYTAQSYRRRKQNPYVLGKTGMRPQNQGSNPFADMGCLEALRLTGQYIARATNDASDIEARHQMMFASMLAGAAMGSAGVHLPHGMSYSVSGNNKKFIMDGYPNDHVLIPHGVAVILNAPSVFKHTAYSNPERHLKCAQALGADIRGATPQDAGEILHERLVQLMKDTHMPNGLNQVGFSDVDIPALVKGTLPQKRVVDNCAVQVDEQNLSDMFKGAMKYW
ncbi:hydroxyacid-oxoacid transhydrogenase, mitochondrial [Acrasis kona]|uniref:hydroxyacid-oxoacid transhydrogenase n=1 Tax=Acrasis kona TaxID=1008807 RepID=A0AAW2ZDH0_9EUKA